MLSFIQQRFQLSVMTLEMATINGERIRHLQIGEMSWLAQFANFCINNEPCVLHESFTTDWPSRELWVREDGRPNLDYLRNQYGEGLVPVITENKCDPDEITFNKFCDYCESVDAAIDSEPQYLKDWHFQRSYGINMYHVPAMLTSDWVNCESWTDGDDNPFHGDYRFVYFGVKNTWQILWCWFKNRVKSSSYRQIGITKFITWRTPSRLITTQSTLPTYT